MALLRSAWSASTTKNSAFSPLAVCSITHGAILTSNRRRGDSSTRRVMPRDGLIARVTAIPAAMKKNKQRTTRNRDNADMRFKLAIIDAPDQLRLYPKPQKTVNTSAT